MSLFARDRIILDLCGGTGAWSKPYVDAGYDVQLIDIDQDVRLFQCPDEQIYGILAAPPCTHLCLSGARWWEKKGDTALLEALSVVDACLRVIHVCNPKFWCLENPVGRLVRHLGKSRMTFHPYEYGDAYKKRTCLWGDFRIPKRNPVDPVKARTGHHSMDAWLTDTYGKNPAWNNRSKLRNTTPPGFAQAFYEANK